jgi:hypothetical protein
MAAEAAQLPITIHITDKCSSDKTVTETAKIPMPPKSEMSTCRNSPWAIEKYLAPPRYKENATANAKHQAYGPKPGTAMLVKKAASPTKTERAINMLEKASHESKRRSRPSALAQASLRIEYCSDMPKAKIR